MVGEKESWSSSNSGWSKQWTNISTSDSINNQNLQCKSFHIHRLMLSHNNQSFHTKQSKTRIHFIFSYTLFWIDPQIFPYLDYFIFKCILDICLFSHIEFFVYSINSNNNVVDNRYQNPLLSCFHWFMTTVIFPTIWLS